MTRPKLLDLFCKQGGAGMGYHRAGFDVVGVDIEPQPHYPFRFIQADALTYLEDNGAHFDAVHASPPCQAFSNTQRLQGNQHPDLIAPVRELLELIYKPYIIENVEGAPLINPILLCGGMFPGLRTYRHRLFESSFPLTAPTHYPHYWRNTKMGRPPVEGEFMHVVGNFTDVAAGRKAMGMEWATRDGLREAIPPAYTEHIGTQLLAHIGAEAAA